MFVPLYFLYLLCLKTEKQTLSFSYICASEWFIFLNVALLECWLSENFPYYIFSPSLWKHSFDNQPALLFFLLPFSLFTFCPLKLKPFGVCLEFWQFKFKRKPTWGNLFWHIHILTQSFAGLMGWLKTSLYFSHVHLCVRGWRSVYSCGKYIYIEL